MAVFGGVMSKIEFGENWRDRYGLYYGKLANLGKHDFPYFFHENRPYRPIYRNIKKIVFRKKTLFF